MKIKKYLYLFLLLTYSNLCFCKIIFVNGNTVGGLSDGTSWGNAFLDFQNAIDEAVYGDSIWVAQGTYFPTSSNDREISFELKNGVKWFGGFQGNETELMQRDFEIYPTILNGDIGLLNDSIDNSFHVVHSMGADSTTLINGFKIINGYAYGSNQFLKGGGMFLEANEFFPITKPKIVNCIFENNLANSGGAISFVVGSLDIHTVPFISKCNFYQNKAIGVGGSGGAIEIAGGDINLLELIFVEECIFENNTGLSEGGAIFLNTLSNECEIRNCNFINNTTIESNQFGGAISYRNQSSNYSGDLLLIDCNFVGNHALSGGAISIRISNAFLAESFNLTIRNSTFENNDCGTFGFYRGSALEFSSSARSSRILIEDSKFIENSNSVNHSVIRIEHAAFNSTANDSLFFDLKRTEFINNESNVIYLFLVNDPANYFNSISNSIFKGNRNVFRISKNDEVKVQTKINNCSFLNNDVRIIPIDGDDNSFIEIGNSIFWEDLLFTEMFYGGDTSDVIQNFVLHHSLLKSPDCIVNGVDLCGDGMLFNQYPEFRDTLNGDFSLRSCSPAINQGDNASIDSLGIVFDIEGNPRFIDQVVDMGAYETQAFESFTPQIQDESCAEAEDGSVFWVQHGTPPFDFEWNNGITSGNNMSNLSAGNYSFTVTDADSCMEVINIEIDAPLPLLVMDTITHATAINAADGSINLMPSGGTSDYDFIWENGDTTAILNNLIAGFYQVTVTDANGCFLELEYEVEVVTAVDNSFEQTKIQLLPNISPKNISINLWIENDKNEYFEIEILNELGQVIFYKKIKTQGGKNVYKIPAPQSAGLFFVKIKNKEGAQRVLKYMVL